MASASKTAAGTWRARFRDASGNTQSKSGFRLKSEALDFAKSQEVAAKTGSSSSRRA